jgi:hypothetical protein
MRHDDLTGTARTLATPTDGFVGDAQHLLAVMAMKSNHIGNCAGKFACVLSFVNEFRPSGGRPVALLTQRSIDATCG